MMSETMVDDFLNRVSGFLEKKDNINVAIATGTTLQGFAIALSNRNNVPYERINVFVVDEYAGISAWDERSCTIDLIRGLRWNKFKSFNYFSSNDYKNEIGKLNKILNQQELDIAVLGIGKDGHLAFCYPPYRLHENTYYVLRQFNYENKKTHVHNGWFHSVSEVPNYAITLSIWGILNCKAILIGAVYSEKHKIINLLRTTDGLNMQIPAFYLQLHNDVTIHIG